MEAPKTCFIGGEKFDSDPIEEYLTRLPKKSIVVTGNGRGAEERVQTEAKLRGLKVVVPPLQVNQFVGNEIGRRQALKLQVVDVYVQALLGGTLVLIGKGYRIDEARDMLTRSTAWPMEVVEL